MPRPLCIYHKNCLDGSGAAAVVEKFAPTAEFLPMQYSHPPPTVEGREVYLVDFGFPLEHMRALKAQATRLTWIDHHSSAEPVYRALGWGHFDTDECGASLTWKTLFPGKAMPPILGYIRDKDLWKWELPDSRAIAAGLSELFSNSRYKGLLEADLTAMAERGRPLLEARRLRLVEAVKSGVVVKDPLGVSGLTALVLNTPKDQNELGEFVCQPVEEGGLGYDLAIIFYRKQEGPWVHSLRARSGSTVDCGAIAARFGGGGHPGSACFLSLEPILKPAAP